MAAQRFANRVALITGAGSGIGRATALAFAREGAHVALLDVDASELDHVVKQIDQPERCLTFPVDIRDPERMERSVNEIVSRWNRLEIVFANAGINGVWGPIDEFEIDEWDRTIDINLTGTFLTLRYAVPFLKKNGGSIVITSSVNGTRMFSNSGATAYACTKAAQVAMAKMLALELARDKIRVNVICPGAIDTAIDESTEARSLEEIREPVAFPEGKIPLTDGRPGTAAEVADLVLFLCSEAARHMTGTEVWIDGGQSLLQG